jgi:hypothetical protein
MGADGDRLRGGGASGRALAGDGDGRGEIAGERLVHRGSKTTPTWQPGTSTACVVAGSASYRQSAMPSPGTTTASCGRREGSGAPSARTVAHGHAKVMHSGNTERRRLGAGTAYDWRRIVESRLIPAFGERPVPAIDVEAVEGFIASLKRGEAATAPAPDTTDRRRHPRVPKKLSNRRVNIVVKVLRQSLDRAVGKGWLPDNPARKVDLLREDKPEIDPFSLAEAKTFISEGLQDEEHRRYFHVGFFSGLRPGEQIGLQWDDVDWERRMIRVRRLSEPFRQRPDEDDRVEA